MKFKDSNIWIKTIHQCFMLLLKSRHNELKDICGSILNELVEISDSEFGFIAELMYDKKGNPFFRYRAVQGKKSFNQNNDYYTKYFLNNDETDLYDMNTLLGLPYTTNKVVISNDVENDPRCNGELKLSKSDLLIHKFYGIPIKENDNIIGIMCLANTNNNYEESHTFYLEPFTYLISYIMMEWRRRKAIDGSRNRFLLHMSHEIKTPLNGIIGMTQHLLDTELTTEQLDIIDYISQCNLRLLTIINDVGDFYKITMGHIELNMEPVNINEIINEIYELYKNDIEQKQLIFKYKINENIKGDIITDRKRLLQVIMNLVSNAVKYTHSGSIQVNIDIDKNKTRALKELNEKKYDKTMLKFIIKDTGIGIDRDRLDVIFHDFQNMDNGLVIDPNTGRGLGLSISRLLIKTFNGKIKIDSKLGEGTIVTFWIETKISNNITLIKDYVKNKIKGTYAFILTDNQSDRVTLSSLLISIGMIPIIPNNEIEARMYIDNVQLNFMVAVVSEKYINNQLILDIQTKYNDIIMIGVVSQKKSSLVTNYVPLKFTELDILIPLHDYYKKQIDFESINQETRNIGVVDTTKTINTFIEDDTKIKDLTNKIVDSNETNNSLNKVDKLHQKSSILHNSLSNNYLKDNDQIKILIAEDEVTNQKVIKTALYKLGFSNIDIASDGQIMCKRVVSKDYDLILIDIKMPIMDGYTASANVISFLEKEKRPIPIMIAVTALEDMYMKERCAEVGIHYVLKKPFSFVDLQKIMKIVKEKKGK